MARESEKTQHTTGVFGVGSLSAAFLKRWCGVEGADLVGLMSTVLRYLANPASNPAENSDIAAHTGVGCGLLPDDASASRQGGAVLRCGWVVCAAFSRIRAEMRP